jgi:hypothetical protein
VPLAELLYAVVQLSIRQGLNQSFAFVRHDYPWFAVLEVMLTSNTSHKLLALMVFFLLQRLKAREGLLSIGNLCHNTEFKTSSISVECGVDLNRKVGG